MSKHSLARAQTRPQTTVALLLGCIVTQLWACHTRRDDEGSMLPIIWITTPSEGERVHETISVGALAVAHDAEIESLEAFANGLSIGAERGDRLAMKWDTRNIPTGGPFEIKIVAIDTKGRRSEIKNTAFIDRGTRPAGREAIYSIMNDGSLETADLLCAGIWDLGERSQPVYIDNITWLEDPFDKYWRFLFYSLRPLSNLLWAYTTQGDTRYRDKLLEILRSYVAYDAVRIEHADWTFDDSHTAAFRAMSLVNLYFALQQTNDLDAELAEQMHRSIIRIGSRLLNPRNFDPGYNHGVTEGAALLLIAANFPDDTWAPVWQSTALARLDDLMVRAVDEDAVEVEKSPFYHFYVMTFGGEIARWAKRFDVPLSSAVVDKVAAMSRYSTYIVHPNGQVPLIGASVAYNARRQDRSINESIGQFDPLFEYVRTAGAAGAPPTERNVLFEASGHSIMRSGFGSGAEFTNQTHIVFNVGPLRTEHSHLDGLALVYAAGGHVLLPDGGLFAYESSYEVDYFRSTRAHNTVVVDGGDHGDGTNSLGATLTGPNWAYQSGAHTYYAGVEHWRAVTLLERDLALVVDSVKSDGEHDYTQTWHFLPEATLAATVQGSDDLDAVAIDTSGKPLVAVRQALAEGISLTTVRGQQAPLQGWYSEKYGVMVENSVAEYHLRGVGAELVTMIASGQWAQVVQPLRATWHGSVVTAVVCAPPSRWTITIDRANVGLGTEATVIEERLECD